MKFQILLIDQNLSEHAALIQRLEMEGYQVDVCAEVDHAERKLLDKPYDLIIMDPVFPPRKEFQLFDFIKGKPTLQWIPLIALSKRNNMHDQARCYDLGADDYFVKPVTYDQLGVRIPGLIQKADEIKDKAFRDPLTKVYNRQFFNNYVQAALQRVRATGGAISLAFIDADRFKRINDTFGHDAGDKVLIGLSALIQRNLRSTDVLCRFGGEEFVVLLPGMNAEQALRKIQDILGQVHQEPVATIGGHSHYITFSSGIAEWRETLTIETWIKEADEAVYRAKEEGRDRVLLASNSKAEEEKQLHVMIGGTGAFVSYVSSLLRGYRIGQVVSQQEAVAYINDHNVDFCILEHEFSSIDAMQLIQEIKGGEFIDECKVILVLPENPGRLVVQNLAIGTDEILISPLTATEFTMAVARVRNEVRQGL